MQPALDAVALVAAVSGDLARQGHLRARDEHVPAHGDRDVARGGAVLGAEFEREQVGPESDACREDNLIEGGARGRRGEADEARAGEAVARAHEQRDVDHVVAYLQGARSVTSHSLSIVM